MSPDAPAIPVYDWSGAKKSTVKPPDSKEISATAMAAAVRVTMANDRRERPLAKTRAHVAGGGRKPWRQKGTGRARAGTYTSPLFRSGGAIFGPTGEPRPKKHLPAKLRKVATGMVLRRLVSDDRLRILDGKPNLTKTKDAAKVFKKFELRGSALLVVAPSEVDDVAGCRNLARVELTTTEDCNTADFIRHANTLISKAAWGTIAGGDRPKPVAKEVAPAKARAVAKAPAKPAAKKPSDKGSEK